MIRLAIWLFAFSPMLLALVPAARDRWGVALPLFTCFTLAVGIALELTVRKKRGSATAATTPQGNWLAKGFGTVLVAALIVVLSVGIRRCATT